MIFAGNYLNLCKFLVQFFTEPRLSKAFTFLYTNDLILLIFFKNEISIKKIVLMT